MGSSFFIKKQAEKKSRLEQVRGSIIERKESQSIHFVNESVTWYLSDLRLKCHFSETAVLPSLQDCFVAQDKHT